MVLLESIRLAPAGLIIGAVGGRSAGRLPAAHCLPFVSEVLWEHRGVHLCTFVALRCATRWAMTL